MSRPVHNEIATSPNRAKVPDRHAGYQLALEERLADGSVHHEVVCIERLAPITAAAVDVGIRRQRGLDAR